MSDSESDSEGDKLRKTKRSVVVKFEFKDSDSSSSDDSDDRPIMMSKSSTRNLRNRKLPTSNDDSESGPSTSRSQKTAKFKNCHAYESDADSSDSSWCPDAVGETSATANNQLYSLGAGPENTDNIAVDDGFTTDSSLNDSLEKCPICLHSFRDQEIGTPNNCDHSYCAPCIEEWSKNVQTCPIDRKEFDFINIKDNYVNGNFLKQIKVEAQKCTLEENVVEDLTHCEVCGQSDREDLMLLCDGCNRGYHMDCLNPPLTEVPSNSWYCDYCFASDASAAEEDDINQLIEEMEMEIGVPETRLRVRRIEDTPRIVRTRQSERIRATILSRIAPSRRHAAPGSRETALGMTLPGTLNSTFWFLCYFNFV